MLTVVSLMMVCVDEYVFLMVGLGWVVEERIASPSSRRPTPKKERKGTQHNTERERERERQRETINHLHRSVQQQKTVYTSEHNTDVR